MKMVKKNCLGWKICWFADDEIFSCYCCIFIILLLFTIIHVNEYYRPIHTSWWFLFFIYGLAVLQINKSLIRTIQKQQLLSQMTQFKPYIIWRKILNFDDGCRSWVGKYIYGHHFFCVYFSMLMNVMLYS